VVEVEAPVASPDTESAEGLPAAASLDGGPAAPAATEASLTSGLTTLSSRPAESPDAAWAEVLTRLEGLASRADRPDSDGFGAEAGRVAIEHAGAPEKAEELLARAVASGIDHPAVLAAYSIAVGALGDHPRLRDLLVRRGGELSGAAGADLLQDAALVERHQLGRDQAAVQLLERSVALASEEATARWFGLQLLRDLHAATGDWSAAAGVLDQMAGLAVAGETAPFWMELGAIREEHLEDWAGARDAYMQAIRDGSTDPQAVVGVERCASRAGDPAALSELFGVLADRAEGVDAGMWFARQARAHGNAGEVDHALRCWGEVLNLGAPAPLRLEAFAALADQGQWGPLHVALRAEAERSDGPGPGWARAWAAEIAESHLDDLASAIEDIQAVLEVDRGSEVAREALERALLAADRAPEAVAFLEGLAGQDSDPNHTLNLHFRIAELREHTLNDHQSARTHYEKTLEISPAYLPALDGLERCAHAMGDWAAVAAVHTNRAALQSAAIPSAGHLVAAAMVSETRLQDTQRALDLFQQALVKAPCDPLALGGLIRVAAAAGDTERVLGALQAAAAATEDETRRVSLMYRIARVQQQGLGDLDQARATLAACVEHSPAFRPAAAQLVGLARAAKSWAEVATLEAAAAETSADPKQTADHFLAAARAARRANDTREADFIQAVLRLDRDHASARAEADLRAILTGDLGVRQTLLLDTAATDNRPSSYAVLADFCAATGNREGATKALESAMAHGGAAQMPSFLGALATRLGSWDLAIQLAEAAGDWTSAGTIHALRRDDSEAAEAAWSKAGDTVEATTGQVRLAGLSGDREALELAHRQVAECAETPGLRGLHAVFAGRLAAARGDAAGAVESYRLGLGDTLVRGRLVDGIIRAHVDANDAEALHALFAQVPEMWPGERAELLAEAGDHPAAAEAFQALASDGDLATAARVAFHIRAEQSLMEADDWRGVLESLRAQTELVSDDATTRTELGARQRWILAEKLADSDDAWEQYQMLFKADPDNAEVLEALARIAGARGLTEQAIEYLDRLSSLAPDAVTSARYRRRAAEVHLQAGDQEKAQAELSRAVELNPEDAEALASLRVLAEEQEDWQALVGVMAREASVMEGDARLDRLRSIATTWEDRLEDPAVAMDGWRKVLSGAPEDAEALTHLVQLSRQMQDWTTFAEVAAGRLQQLEAADKAALQAELGTILLRQLYNEEAAVQHLEEASRGDHLQLNAALELERIYLSAGLWDKAVEVMLRRAAASEGEEQVSCLLRAAQTCLEMTGNREATSSIYQTLLEADPTNTTALQYQADLLYSTGDMEGAVDVFQRLEADFDELDLEDEDEDDVLEIALSLFRYGQALESLGRSELAIIRYEKVAEINPAHLPSLEAVGPLYMETGNWNKAGKAFRQILRLTSGQGDPARLARTYTSLGRVELQVGNLDKAERRFAKALQVRPNDISALTGSADVLLKRGDTQTGEQRSDTWRRLLTVYNQIIYHAQTPEEVVYAYLTKGFVLDARLDLADKAAQHYRKSLAFDGSQPSVLLRLAEHALRRQDWPEAESLATQGLALETIESEHRAGLHLVRYCAFSACGDAQAAQDEFEAAVATEEALATDLGDSPPGATAVHDAVRERLRARL
jgi:tetratricopeptide (TPR) repeat protein